MTLLRRLTAVFLLASASLVFSAGASAAQSGRPAPPRGTASGAGALDALHARIDSAAESVMPKVVALRRDLHEHPELGNRETRTSARLAERLRALGFEVRAGVAKTGVVGVLRGGRPGPVVALRSDMDGLPVTEETGLPFASKARAQFNGRDVGVMHACGHDMHMAMLMGAAEVLAGMKADLPGTVVIIYQPAEEGAPEGEEGGAELMVKEGVHDNPPVSAIFGLHVGISMLGSGSITFRPRGLMAASDTFEVVVHGKSTHGALPWAGVDPIVVASQIVLGLQTVISRQSELTTAPAVLTVGTIEGGNRFNIVPDVARLTGTIRTFDPDMQKRIHENLKRTAENIAAASGAKADVRIEIGNPVTWNDVALTERMAPSLKRVAAGGFDPNAPVTTTAEDFSAFQKKVPGLFFFLGVAPKGTDPSAWHTNHSSQFNPDESAMVTGVRALASVAVDYLAGAGK